MTALFRGLTGPRKAGLLTSVCVLVVLGPTLLRRGFSLVGDMVFVPRQRWKDAWLGLDGSVPRAVPGDAVVSLLTYALPGDLLQKLVLLAILLGAAWGVVALCRDLPWPASAAAGLLAVWNPYVHERLGIGHWALLAGYAALPWVAVLAGRVGQEGWRRLPTLVVPLAVAGWTSPTGGLLTVLVAVVVTGWTSRARACGVAAAGLVVNLPWLVVGVLNTGATADALGVEAFAARSDTPGGTGVSLATLGGIWKTSIHPVERTGALGLLFTVVVVLSVLALVRAVRRDGPILPLTTVAVVLLLGTWFLSTGAGAPLARWMVTEVPGGGLIRDSQKLVAPWAIVVAVGFGHLVALLTRLRSDVAGPLLVLAFLLPPALLPSLAWGRGGDLAPATYPDEWAQADSLLTTAGAGDSSTAVLPMSTYRRFEWNDHKAVLDPAPRFFPGQVVTDDSLVVAEGRVDGEDPVAADLRRAEAAGELPAALDRHGIRFVVIERASTGTAAAPEVPAGRTLLRGDDLIVVDRGQGVTPPRVAEAAWVLLIDLVAVLLVLLATGVATMERIRRNHAYTPR